LGDGYTLLCICKSRGRRATYPAVCGKRATLMGNVDRGNRRLQRARNGTSGWNVKWPAVRAWGLIPLPNIGLMGGESGPLGRRHSGRGRAVPVRCPSIVRSSLRLCGCTCPCPARRGERVVQSWSPRYVLEPPWRTRSSCPASNLSVNPMWPVCRAPLCGASMTSVRAICHKRPNERFSTVSLRKMPSTQLRLPRHQAILKLSPWSVPRSNNSRLN